jgi:hypothetical protein
MQVAIERVAAAQSEAELDAALRVLAGLAGPGYRDLVPQLVVFTRQPRDARAALAPGVIRERLGITDAQLLDGLLPMLEAPDGQQRAQLYNWLGGIDARSGEPRDFSLYRRVIAARRDAPPLGLVRYMYDSDAETAVAVLAEVYAEPAQRRALVEARRPVNQAWAGPRAGRPPDAAQIAAARAALQTLARYPEWWVRAYAAAALVQMPPLRTPELLQPLQADPHPLVRDLVQEKD